MIRKFTIMLAVFLVAASIGAGAASDGAALYKSKCAGCHGANGEGKPPMKAPALKGTDKSVDQLVSHITNGEPQSKPPHNKGMSGLTDEQAKSIAEYVKSLP
jgi:cytochrome c